MVDAADVLAISVRFWQIRRSPRGSDHRKIDAGSTASRRSRIALEPVPSCSQSLDLNGRPKERNVIEVIWGSAQQKPVSSRLLADDLSANVDGDGYLYIGYPIIGSPTAQSN